MSHLLKVYVQLNTFKVHNNVLNERGYYIPVLPASKQEPDQSYVFKSVDNNNTRYKNLHCIISLFIIGTPIITNLCILYPYLVTAVFV